MHSTIDRLTADTRQHRRSRGTATSTSSTSTSTGFSAIQTATQTLQTDLPNDTPSGAHATHASIGAVEDDLDAIRKGTLSGSAAVAQDQTDPAAVLASIGLSRTQIAQIQVDQSALATAIAANSASSTSTSSTWSATSIAAIESTLQSVSAHLVGVPGISVVGMRGMDGGHFGGGFGGGSSGNTVELPLTILKDKTCDRLVPTLPRGNTRLGRSRVPADSLCRLGLTDAGASNTAFPRRSVETRTKSFFASKLTLIQRYWV
jgi:hypothetical protein